MMPSIERPDMSNYGVPRDPEGVLPWAWASTRLLKNRNYWVATVDPHGRPHSMPVWGIWVPDTERFWFACDAHAFKARNLSTNPHIVVANEDTVEVVSLEGTAADVPPDRSIAEAFGAKYETDPEKAGDLVNFMLRQSMHVVTPVKAFGIIEREDEFSARATRWVW